MGNIYKPFPAMAAWNEPSDDWTATHVPHHRVGVGEWASPPFYIYRAGPYQSLTVRLSESQENYVNTIDTNYRYYSPHTTCYANFTSLWPLETQLCLSRCFIQPTQPHR